MVLYSEEKAHYVVVTGILINSKGKYLITKRAGWEKAFPNMWTVPGGKLESKDYKSRAKDTSVHWYNVLEDLLIREIREEVGLNVKRKDIGYVTSLVYERDDGIPTLIVSLYAKVDVLEEDNVKLCSALTEYAWVDLEEAKNYDLIEGIYEEIEILHKHLRSGKSMEWGEKNG